jgi:predicted amidohydrolase
MPVNTQQVAAQLRLGIYQFAPRMRALSDNLGCIADAARRASADLLLTPELSLTGYDLRDEVHTYARPFTLGDAAPNVWGPEALALEPHTVIVGAIERAEAMVPYNAAVVVQRGTVTHVQRKVYLPTYGMFDEGRYFGRGQRVEPLVVSGWRLGLLICEDFWHPMLAYLHALQGAHALLVMAAAPGRGVWEGGEEGAFFASTDAWERIARAYAQLYGVYVIVCNRCGVEGGVTFGGESLVVAPDASIVARAGVDEQLLQVDLTSATLVAARTPYAHLRDDDPTLALLEIERVVKAR